MLRSSGVIFFVLSLFLSVTFGPPKAEAVELLTNGSFETGDFTGWTTEANNGNGSWDVLQNGETHSKGGIANEAPSDGVESAMANQTASGTTQALWQNVSIPAGATNVTLTFDWGVTRLDVNASDIIRADVTTQAANALTEADGILLNVLNQNGAGGNVAVWQNSNTDLSAYAGQDVRIRFWVTVTDGLTRYFLDNVSLDYTPAAGGGGGTNNYTLNVTLSGYGRGWVSSDPAGIDCPSACSATFDEGTVVTLTPGVNSVIADSEFGSWGGDCGGSGSCSVTMDTNRSVDAAFNYIGSGGGNNGNGNSDPGSPGLLEPPDGATFRTALERSVYREAEVTFKWNKSSDADGDEVSYKLWICENNDFDGCDPVNINSDGSLASLMGIGGFGVGLVMFGFAFRNRRNVALMLVAGLIMVGGMTACSSSSSSDDDDTTTTDDSSVISYTATLSSGSYFWKVTATDANGGSTDSEVRTFTVGE